MQPSSSGIIVRLLCGTLPMKATILSGIISISLFVRKGADLAASREDCKERGYCEKV